MDTNFFGAQMTNFVFIMHDLATTNYYTAEKIGYDEYFFHLFLSQPLTQRIHF
jgi:hypothetical protein